MGLKKTMLSLDDLREIMSVELDATIYQKTIEITAPTIEEALKQASIEMNVPISHLEYEIKAKGSKGLVGGMFLKKDYILSISISTNFNKTRLDKPYDEDDQVIKTSDKNGTFGVELRSDGNIYLKIFPPVGRGLSVLPETVVDYIYSLKNIPKIDEPIIHKAVRDPKSINEWKPIGSFQYNEKLKPSINVSVSDDAMRASITINTLPVGCISPTIHDINNALAASNIVYGIKNDVLEEIILHPTYRIAILIAEGNPPQNGNDTGIEFTYDIVDITDKKDKNKSGSKNKKQDKNENFRSAYDIASVHKGAVIAKIVQPGKGINGINIRNETINAIDGMSKEIQLGNNVQISIDKTKIIATSDGQPVYKDGIISVDEIKLIQGDLKDHLNFVGTIIIKGDVGDGYDVRAKGDILITGSVGKSQLTAGGNIIVDGGINGGRTAENMQHDENINHLNNINLETISKEEKIQVDISHIIIRCSGNLWSKFIQNTKVEVGNFVIVSDGILNSDVTAMKKVLLKGKRSAIVGGRVRAVEEINATILGSNSGTITHLEISIDPLLKDELVNMKEKLRSMHREIVQNKKNIKALQDLGKEQVLPPDKARRMEEIERLIEQQNIDYEDMELEIENATSKLKQGLHNGKISASKIVNGGVSLTMYDIEHTVTESSPSGVTFYEDIGLINIRSYEEFTDNISKDSAKDKFTNK